MSDQVRAIAMLSALGCAALAVLAIGGEVVFTRPLDRPSRWSGASVTMLVCAFGALTVAMWPTLAASWPELWRMARG